MLLSMWEAILFGVTKLYVFVPGANYCVCYYMYVNWNRTAAQLVGSCIVKFPIFVHESRIVL